MGTGGVKPRRSDSAPASGGVVGALTRCLSLDLEVGRAAAELNSLREGWLNPAGVSAAELRKRTLTNLYNQRPTCLDNIHDRLDAAAAEAYGWPADLPDGEILEWLLALNLERAGAATNSE